MRITKAWLKKHDACRCASFWFWEQGERDGIAVVEKLIKEEEYEWAGWFLVRLLTRKQRIRLANYITKQTPRATKTFFGLKARDAARHIEDTRDVGYDSIFKAMDYLALASADYYKTIPRLLKHGARIMKNKQDARKTSKRALTALFESFSVKWNDIVNRDGVDEGPGNCPLCELYYPDCDKCPICIETGEICCEKTPYDEWEEYVRYRRPRRIIDAESLRLAMAERDWLEALYKKLVRRNKRKASGK